MLASRHLLWFRICLLVGVVSFDGMTISAFGSFTLSHSFTIFRSKFIIAARALHELHRRCRRSTRRVAHPLGIVNGRGVPHPSRFSTGGLEVLELGHGQQPGFVEVIKAVAAPAPLVWQRDQTTRHRIAVHVSELLDPFAFAIDVEIIEALLPEVIEPMGEEFRL